MSRTSAVGSTRESVPSRLFATHTAPSPTAIPLGPSPTGKVSVCEPDWGSSFESVGAGAGRKPGGIRAERD